MSSTHVLRHLLAASALTLAFAASAAAADPFMVTSTTFKDGQLMPRKVANTNPQNPNCVGENVSPQLSWSNAPEGTKSFALLMEDPEGRGGAGVHHWVAYGIPASVTSFAEGEVSKPSEKSSAAKARRASATTRDRVRRPARRITTRSSSLQLISTPRSCRPA